MKGVVDMLVKGSDEINEMKIPLEMNFKVVFFKEAKLTDDLKKGDIIYWFDELCIVTGEFMYEDDLVTKEMIELIPYTHVIEETDEYIYSERHDGCKCYISAGIDIPVVKYLVPVPTV